MSVISNPAGAFTVQAERVGKDAQIFRPIVEVDSQRVNAGVFSTASEAALAYDLLMCKLAPDASHLALHHELAFLQAQPLFNILLEGSFEDLTKTLRGDPCLLDAFPRHRGHLGSLKMKLEVLEPAKSTSKSSRGDSVAKKLLPHIAQAENFSKLEAVPEDEATSLPVPHNPRGALSPLLPLSQNIRSAHTASTYAPKPIAADPLAELRALLGPVEPLHPAPVTTAPESAVPPAAPSAPKEKDPCATTQSANVRTNWATFPSGTNSQSVVLTKFQVTSGSVSVPAARCHSVLGRMDESCTVKLQDGRNGTTYQISCKLYPSQPTQVFLQRLKPYFQAAAVKPGDVLSLALVKRGICKATIFPLDHPKNLEFRASLPHGWSDMAPLERRPEDEFSPAPEFMLYDGGIENSRAQRPEPQPQPQPQTQEPQVHVQPAPKRERPVRKISPLVPFGSSGGDTSEWNGGSSGSTMRAVRKRAARGQAHAQVKPRAPAPSTSGAGIKKVGRPRKPVKSWDDEPEDEAENANTENVVPQGRYIMRRASAQKFLDNSRQRRSEPVSAAPPPAAPLPLPVLAPIDEAEEERSFSVGLNFFQAPEVSPANHAEVNLSPPSAAQSGVRKPRTGAVQGGGIKKPMYGMQRRSNTTKMALRRLRRKGCPTRAPEGEPNCQAYAEALALFDAGHRLLF